MNTAQKILSKCRLVVTHLKDAGRIFLRWYDEKRKIVARGMVTKYFDTVVVYSGNKANRFVRPSEVDILISTFSSVTQRNANLAKQTAAGTQTFIKFLAGKDRQLAQALAFAVPRGMEKRQVNAYFKQAA